MSSRLFVLSFVAAIALTPRIHAADPAATAGTRLRDSLRNTMLQMRTLQAERDTLEAARVENEQKAKAVTAELEALKKQAATDNESQQKTIGSLRARVEEQDRENAGLKADLDQAKRATAQAAELACGKEAERAKVSGQLIEAQRRVADREMKNAALFRLGKEILERYEKFGLGTALTAKEPFVGVTRVKLQNLVQDYSDKLVEQKAKP
jgi:chromosome segregation ATPase